jgi:hypothetical protein
MIVDMDYIKDLNMGYHKLKSYSEIYQYEDDYICNKCALFKNKENLICIHDNIKKSGIIYCLECIGGLENIEKFYMSELILKKVLE